MIDLIIPVYRGLAETRRCLESVLGARVDVAHEVTVIDDASPEPGMAAWLRELAASGRITLLSHETNRGFVATANEGMALHPDRDLVLLNSDTQVASGWLDRLAACARREPDVGTVSPFSNNATICSYPRISTRNRLPTSETTASLDATFARANSGQRVELPTAVGFCMYISRACLAEVGHFDEEAFGRGYGEEVDFCLRASRAGYRHLLCADTFVFHEGEVSFGGSGQDRRQSAQRIVDERYPEFQPRLRDFLMREPIRPLRRAVDLARLRASPRPRVLFVSHRWGGGVQKHVDDLAATIAPDVEVLLLQPQARDVVALRWLREGEEFEAFFEAPADWPALLELLASLSVSRMHLHHVHGLPASVLDLPARLGIEYDVTLHDNFAICPQYHLADEFGRYCGEPDVAGCTACLAKRPAQWPMDIVAWRKDFHDFLRKAARAMAPSRDLALRTQKHFPDVSILEWPHPQALPPAPPRLVKVLILGSLSAIKGLDMVAACVNDAMARALPLRFRVLGHLERSLPTWPDAPLSLSGSYPDERLAEMIELERADVFLFPSQVPESFSYTLTVAMQAGLPIVATDLGALPERLKGYAPHSLIAWDASAATVNDALLAAANAGLQPMLVALGAKA